MDSISRGTKRSLPDDATAASVPRAKRARTAEEPGAAEALALLSHGPATLLPFDVVHAIGIINTTLLNGERWLDLSSLPAAALAGIPADALDAAIGRIESLMLPEQLVELPAFCSRMRSLQILHLRGYWGRQLDLSALPALTRVEGRAHSVLDEIWLNDRAAIALAAPGRVSKIRCFRMRDGMIVSQHALPGHAYYKALAGRSLPDLRNLNHSACFAGTRTPITCSDITQYVNEALPGKSALPKDSYLGITDPASLTALTDSQTRRKFFEAVTTSSGYHYVDDMNFGLWASEQLAQMKAATAAQAEADLSASSTHAAMEPPGATRIFYALTGKHAMSLVLRYKPGEPEKFAAILMDPNQTLTHRRIEENQLARVNSTTGGWQISRLLPDGAAPHYLPPAARPAWLFVDATRRAEGERPQVDLSHLVEINGDVLYALSLCAQGEGIAAVGRWMLEDFRNGRTDAASVFRALTAERLLDTRESHCFGLQLILHSGYAEAATAYVQVITDFARAVHERGWVDVACGQIPADFCHHLLRPGDAPSFSIAALYLSQACGPAAKQASFRAYAEGLNTLLVEQLISTDACVSLLMESWASWNILECALLKADAATFSAFGRLLIRLHRDGAIDLEQCREILGGTHAAQEPMPLLWTVCGQGWSPALQAFADLVNELALQERLQAPVTDLMDFFDTDTALPAEESATRICRVLLDPLLFGADTQRAARELAVRAPAEPPLRPALVRLASCLRNRSAPVNYAVDILSA